ncbi:MAG: penicillin-binding transpeptidase domain-containing protein, partial [Trebonia sp.]
GTVTLSPLQLAMAYAAIGNGGTLYSPRLGKAIVSPSGSVVKTIDAPSTKLPVPANVLSYEQQALAQITTNPLGTASTAFAGFPNDKYTVSGKTGTAEVQAINSDGTVKDPTAWFASYGGPAGQPAQYAVVVMVSQGAQGGVTAAPAVREIYDGIWGLDGPNTLPHDKFAQTGPALANGAPPSAIPVIAGLAPATSASAPASADSTVPKALSVLGANLLATHPDRRAGPATSAWDR